MPSFNHRFEPATISGFPVFAVVSSLFVAIFLALSILSYTLSIVFCIIFGFACLVFLVVTIYFIRIDDEIIFQKDIFESFVERNLITSDVDKSDSR